MISSISATIRREIVSILMIFLIGFIVSPVISQVKPASSRDEIDKQYQENIKKTRINGVYIPKDIEDAYEEFIHLSPVDAIASFKNAEEEMAAKKLHFGLGRWMIVNWSFYEGSRLSDHLRSKGILHPDDMANFLIRIFHRKLNAKDLDESSLIEAYAKQRQLEREKLGSIHIN